SLTPGQHRTFTKSGAITGTVNNTATASGAFDDPSSTSASKTATATVNGHACSISLTKTPDQTSVCNGSSVTYTYVVTNNSDAFSWTGTLTDNVLGTISGSFTLAPAAHQTFTKSGAITGTVNNTATASGAFDDPSSTSASKTATRSEERRVGQEKRARRPGHP